MTALRAFRYAAWGVTALIGLVVAFLLLAPAPRPGEGGAGRIGGDFTMAQAAGGALLDLNTATSAQLEDLPGVGPVTATAIVAWRTQHGRFSTIEELQEVDGIGPRTYESLSPLVRV